MTAINRFLLDHHFTIAGNPCVSPDFCLDWEGLRARLKRESGPQVTVTLRHHHRSRFTAAGAVWRLVEDEYGNHAWLVEATESAAVRTDLLGDGVALGGRHTAFPATWANLLKLKNLVQEEDALSTIFPSSRGGLDQRSIGVGARFTTLHWPAVQWAMTHLGISLVGNQNSIPRELVFDVDAMLAGTLDRVPFPFIGSSVPEGHQGQSVEGMSHGSVLTALKTGFHQRRIPWGFNADHQPIGGKFDAREDRLVQGCLLASSITFDLSPELAQTKAVSDPAAARAWCLKEVNPALLDAVRARVARAGVTLDDAAFHTLLTGVWPAVRKMQQRDRKYAAARAAAFTTAVGRAYVRELSIDELPGLTTPATLATMLALCEALDMPVQYVAPAFGFQKNFPFADQVELERRISAAWAVCKDFNVSIGFHSGSGKSAENYRLCGRITGGRLEIKTSGRYTYEMGRALAASSDANDRALWRDWWSFTRDLATASAFAEDATEKNMARQFIVHALERSGKSADVFADQASCAAALAALTPDPDHMFWFEYNFLFVLAAGGKASKSALGDHGQAGYQQRARFYAISEQARLGYARNVAEYLCFLCETTGLVGAAKVAAARSRLATFTSYTDLVQDIAP
ncbi:hypothetical protein LBMAG53_31260 [Planctomycetota bacterium]|nr:hypothetical protein LBMAG53_31260 [Planctomycetota bacterium]